MDIPTLLTLMAGLGVMVWGMAKGGGIGAFFDLPSLAITLGGILIATLLTQPISRLIGLGAAVGRLYASAPPDPAHAVEHLVYFAEEARRQGILSLEEAVQEQEDPFLRKGMQLVVDGTHPETVREILETEIDNLADRHKAGHAVVDQMAAVAPACGLIGTLIGLVRMLNHLTDPGAIGPAMAVALLTALYGVALSNLVFIPLSGRLKAFTAREIYVCQMITLGVLSIQAGDTPRVLREKLETFLPPGQRSPGQSARALLGILKEEEAS